MGGVLLRERERERTDVGMGGCTTVLLSTGHTAVGARALGAAACAHPCQMTHMTTHPQCACMGRLSRLTPRRAAVAGLAGRRGRRRRPMREKSKEQGTGQDVMSCEHWCVARSKWSLIAARCRVSYAACRLHLAHLHCILRRECLPSSAYPTLFPRWTLSTDTHSHRPCWPAASCS